MIADFNHDGIAELATANDRDDNVSVLFGTGGGKFSGPKNLPKGTGVADIASGDLNEDGNPDLVVSDGNKYIRISIGKGNGGFAKPTVIKLGGEPIGIQIANLNGDGHLDLAVALGGPSTFGNGAVAILLGNGDGTFQAASLYALEGSGTRLAVVDLDGDGVGLEPERSPKTNSLMGRP